LAGAFLALLLLCVIAPSLLARTSPNLTNPLIALQGPSSSHWFGTDELGRDMYARVAYGSRLSIVIGLGASLIGVTGGIVLGLLAALGGRVADGVLMRLVDVLLAFPGLLLALLVIALAGPGTVNATLAVGIGVVPGYARIIRAQALVAKRSEYVEAAMALGLPRRTLIARHILPNTMGPLLVLATIGIGTTIIAGASLSFLGLGPQPPTAEWGAMLAEGRDFLSNAWWMAVFPGIALTATVVAVTVIGRYFQAIFEGRASA
jgi:peptide/nickel transport system permease protein